MPVYLYKCVANELMWNLLLILESSARQGWGLLYHFPAFVNSLFTGHILGLA